MGYDHDYECKNCEGSGYFDQPDGGEKPCSVCHGAAGVDQKDIDALTARAEAAEAEVTRLRKELTEVQHDYMALVEKTSDW